MEKTQKAIRYLYWAIVPILVLAVGLAIHYYPEPYPFFKSFISKLAGHQSFELLLDNKISSYILVVGFGLCACIGFTNTLIFMGTPEIRYNYLKGALNFIVTAGATFTAIPWDRGSLLILHGIGALLFIAGFGVLYFTHQLLRFIRKHQDVPEERKWDYYLDAVMVVLVLLAVLTVILSFIIFKATDNEIIGYIAMASQKIVLIVDCIAIFLLDVDDI